MNPSIENYSTLSFVIEEGSFVEVTYVQEYENEHWLKIEVDGMFLQRLGIALWV